MTILSSGAKFHHTVVPNTVNKENKTQNRPSILDSQPQVTLSYPTQHLHPPSEHMTDGLSGDRAPDFGTVSGRQFLWGVGLPKGNGGVQRFPRVRRRLALECKGRRELDCKTHPSSRDESRP
ncbi:hypothetical protein G4B88_023926 [Cannabis sativa]|uniref:Uncharacterized protein n=1 Tax=Cannabis sativa TaxID=3483 RepID=A0A7J6GKD7_CANSA|nr:hypothetical protein G4B88_023926 [Cannabis sativa]